MAKEKSKEKIRCLKCGSLFGYLRIRDQTWICRSCGNVSEKPEEKE